MFHTSYLSRYNETLEHGPNYLEPPPELIEGEEEWEIEAILNKKYDKRKKKQMYWIHWKGYLSTHDTWELEDNVHALALLQKWKDEKGRRPVIIRRAQIPTQDQTMYQAHQITPLQQNLTPPNLPRR